MDVRNRQQNLMFGALTVRVNGKNTNPLEISRAVNHIRDQRLAEISTYRGNNDTRKTVFQVSADEETEKSLAARLKALGAKVLRTVNPEKTEEAAKKAGKWLSKKENI